MRALTREGNKLESIDALEIENITSDAFEFFATNCTALTSLNVAYCKNIDNDALSYISNCVNLITLNLQGSGLIDNARVRALVTKCTHLHNLNLNGCKKVTDTSIAAIKLKYLEHISLEACIGVTDTSIESLRHSCPNLQTLRLDDCANISWKVRDAATSDRWEWRMQNEIEVDSYGL
jgi:Leucine-rich repeat (LRR) protein